MTDTPWAHPRVRELVEQALRAEQMRDHALATGAGHAELDQVLAELHLDIGRLVTRLAAGDGVAAPAPAPAPPSFPEDLPEEDDESWYTDEVEVGGGAAPMFSPEELEEATDVPEPDGPALDPALEPSEVTDPSGRFAIATVEIWEGPLRSTLQVGATWRHLLDDVLDRVGPWVSSDDPEALATEVSRLEQATVELPTQVSGLPEEVQVGLVAWLGARAQHLRSRSEDAALRLALDRLHRLRVEEDLPMVHALLPTPRPEAGTWEEDVVRWALLLRGRG